MLFFKYLKMKKRVIRRLQMQRIQKENEIVLQRQKIQNIVGELDALQRSLTVFRNCDLEAGKKVALSIKFDLDRIKEIDQQRTNISATFNRINQGSNGTVIDLKKLAAEAEWQRSITQLNEIEAQVLQKKKSIHGFLVLCEKAKCELDAMTNDAREQYLKLYTETDIQSCLDRGRDLQTDLTTLQEQELRIVQGLQTEIQELSKQYRKAAYFMVGLAVAGMCVASVVAVLISAWAVYILTWSAVTAGMAAWRGRYFFQEDKKYGDLSSDLASILASNHA